MSFLPKPSASVYERPEPITLNLRPSIAKLAEKQLLVDPTEFMVQIADQIGTSVIAVVVYPSCTNYEGRKILVFDKTTANIVRLQKILDPHFVDNAPAGALVPVARFEPTRRGWRLARICAAALLE